MDDKERRTAIIEKIQSLSGVDAERYDRLLLEIESETGRHGYDEQGRLKIAFFDAKTYDVESFDRASDGRIVLQYIPAALERHTVHAAQGYKAICIFVNDVCDADVVTSLAEMGVQFIALRCSGFNNVDLDACRRLGISVARVPAYSPRAVAEHTVGLMLMLNRRLHQAYARNRTGYFVLDGLTGFDMHGKTAGVIGTGKIGKCVVDILRGFGCQLLVYDKFPNESVRAMPQVEYVDLDCLIQSSDIVTLHLPLDSDTWHLIDKGAIEKMKNGVMIINTSRGGLVDTKALIDGLKSGQIGYAGLDVYEEEAGVFFRDMSDKVLTDDVLARLLTFNNVVVTSHQAFLTREALANIASTTLENIRQFEGGKRGGELKNAVVSE